jgi:CRP-like cAMP-binding protein
MSTSALFAPFSRNERRQLVERFRARDVQKGDVLIKEGQRSDGMYIVLSGEIDVRLGHQTVAALREGDIFGEMSLLTKAPATATCAAARRTSLLRLPREDFDQLVLSHPQILVLVSELTDERKKQNATHASRAPQGTGEATPMV